MLVVAGDGGFLFTANELATAVQHRIPLVTLVFNDGAYGNVKRIQQQRFGPTARSRPTSATPTSSPSPRASARSACAPTGPTRSGPALERAFADGGPVVIDVAAPPMPDPWPWFIRRRARGVR